MSRVEGRRDYVQSFAKGLALLGCFGSAYPSLSVSEAAAQADLSRAAARRLLITLEQLGYVTQNQGRFSLTPRVLDLGFGYLAATGLADKVSPELASLSAAVGESVSAAVLDRGDVVYVARSPQVRIIQAQVMIGSRFPAVSTALGRAILAHLPADEIDDFVRSHRPVAHTAKSITSPSELLKAIAKVREDGYAFVDEELELGLKSIAAAFFNQNGEPAGAINIALVSSTPNARILEELAPKLRECAAKITDLLAQGSK